MRTGFRFKNWIFLLLLTLLVISVVRQQVTMNRINKEIQTSKAQLEEVNNSNETLSIEASKVQSGEYLEMIARKELNMIKSGESTAVNSNN